MNRHPFLPDLGRPLVLASRSPRRADILRAQGLRFEMAPTAVEEEVEAGETPLTFAMRLALEKAQAAARERPAAVCLGCDTIVVLEGSILGKPADETEAAAMLGRLSGRTHTVISALALACADLDHAEVSSQATRVRFRALGPEEIRRYAATTEPLDKAGAYGIQGWGAMMVDAIEGCYFTVMGLPLQSLRELWLSLCRRIQQPSPGGEP